MRASLVVEAVDVVQLKKLLNDYSYDRCPVAAKCDVLSVSFNHTGRRLLKAL